MTASSDEVQIDFVIFYVASNYAKRNTKIVWNFYHSINDIITGQVPSATYFLLIHLTSLSGWGLTKPNGNFARPNSLQKLQGKIWSDSALKSRWGSMIRPGMIGFGTDTTSACMGDSGGPLVCPSKSKPGQFDVIGVVSWGSGRCEGQPGVFTEVAHFLPWIKANMQ